MVDKREKPLIWVGSSREDLRGFPEEVKDDIGFALREVQEGGKPAGAKPLTGYKGAGVLEIIENYRSGTYRAVYTIKFAEAEYAVNYKGR